VLRRGLLRRLAACGTRRPKESADEREGLPKKKEIAAPINPDLSLGGRLGNGGRVKTSW